MDIVSSTDDVLEGIALLLDGHLHHEGDAALASLQQLAADERERPLAALAPPDQPRRGPRPPWLPDRLQLPHAEECPHLAGMWPWHT